ncbi:ATP phosphoribosyltransferase regulatory subunit [Spirulina sp. 06S082]|uniref:ATP phosphoribosyltransferase regulatory subunit n=1 Tax=Spirulina sp. 06S082 TaxID=3110248 RepID=UPI002B214496|nr:ATP phosphoribosyltransferase regulatory subunit [Spirulina sp. 06S082]MEA5467415.1 ATP phosphoribosyltransferase regulatory subunit [Spirulina sp. 06S082]
MIHQPPAGTRDLLPLDVAQKRWIADRLRQVFHQWGYQRIITSTLERMDALTAGGAIDPDTVIQIEDTSEGRLGLRPELTASIARAAVTRMAGSTYPQRLYYNANVFRRFKGGHHGRQMEFYQTGVELLHAAGSLADTEILLLLAEGLQSLGMAEWHIILGEAGLTRSLLSIFPESIRTTIRRCIANLDRVTLESLAHPDLSEGLREKALMLFDLRGKPADVLQTVSSWDLDTRGKSIVNDLKNLCDRLEKSSTHLPIVLDLSLIETIDYYTGIVFEVVSAQNNQYRVLGKGGRYDRLLELYHPEGKSTPGVGFALNLEELHACLLSSEDLPRSTPASDFLVIPTSPQAEIAAIAHAQTLRNAEPSVRVELDLGGRSPEGIREYAKSSRISRLVWIEADGTPNIEILTDKTK